VQERVDEQVERPFNERKTLRWERGFCVVPDGSVAVLRISLFVFIPNTGVVICAIGIVPDIFSTSSQRGLRLGSV
jgi:hypothetical protein